MKTNILSVVMFGVMVITTACSNEDDSLMTGMEKSESREACAPTTTVLIYMAGRNDLSGALMDDLSEIQRGSKNLRQNDNLIVFVRNNHEQQPWVARIKDGLVTDSVSLSDLGIRSSDGENRASDPAVMEGVMHYAFSHYPATSGNYGLVIEGHGCGWLMKQEVSTTMCRAIAVDNGKKKLSSDGRWINIPTMAAILKNMPHLRFIMTDCCNMMCLENLYELRNVCDYMIGSPAEIPAPGAPYDLIVPDMFSQSETFYANITGKYYNSLEGGLPLVAVKTSEMEKVAQATRIALLSVREELAGRYPDMKDKYMSHAADYGIAVDGTVAPDFQAVVKRSRGVAEQMSKGVQFLLKKNNVDVIAGFGKLADNHHVEVTAADGTVETYEAKHIILATGARSRSLPNVPQDGKKIIGYREALTLPELPKSMVVMGSGAIGSELAYFYATMGTQVTIVEYMPRLVPVEDDDVAATLARCFRKAGIKTMTGAAVEKVEVVDDQCVVTVKDSKEKITEITCEIVLSAVGVATNLEGLGLEECGVAFERGKVTVDDYYRTNVEGVYAIGDIVHGPALAHVASHEALVCVEKIAGGNPEPVDYGNIPGCTYTTPEIASVGLTERACVEQGREILVGKFPFTASGKATAAGNRDGLVKVIFDKNTNEWLGCHLIGDNVTEMIAGAVTARKKGMTGPEIINAVFPHPTMSEAVMEAVAVAYGECVHI